MGLLRSDNCTDARAAWARRGPNTPPAIVPRPDPSLRDRSRRQRQGSRTPRALLKTSRPRRTAPDGRTSIGSNWTPRPRRRRPRPADRAQGQAATALRRLWAMVSGTQSVTAVGDVAVRSRQRTSFPLWAGAVTRTSTVWPARSLWAAWPSATRRSRLLLPARAIGRRLREGRQTAHRRSRGRRCSSTEASLRR